MPPRPTSSRSACARSSTSAGPTSSTGRPACSPGRTPCATRASRSSTTTRRRYPTQVDVYRHLFDARASQLADVARALLEPDGLPAVIGCAAGKDRTGVVIALLLDLAGVPTPVIVEDYALTARYFSAPETVVHPPDWRHEPLELLSRPEFMAETLEHLDQAHGGARALLRREGISDADIDRLVERLTEPTP